MKLDPYYNPDSEHYFSGPLDKDALRAKGVTGVRRVCSTQFEVRVYSNGEERWHFLSCPLVYPPKDATRDWLASKTQNVKEALERMRRAKWVTDKAYLEVLDHIMKANALLP